MGAVIGLFCWFTDVGHVSGEDRGLVSSQARGDSGAFNRVLMSTEQAEEVHQTMLLTSWIHV